jgi:hypothetical protein
MSFTESTLRSMRDEAWRRANLVDQHTAAKMIGIDVRTLRRWHDQGLAPSATLVLVSAKNPSSTAGSRWSNLQLLTILIPSAGSHLQTDILKWIICRPLQTDIWKPTTMARIYLQGTFPRPMMQRTANGHSAIKRCSDLQTDIPSEK